MFEFRLKGEDTNLQYIFQSVPRSQRYPLGVKTNYRAYVQDHVYELIQKHDSSNPLCLGLEPWLTHVHSFPTDEQPPLNILIDVPFGAMFLHGYKLGSAAKLPAAIQSFIRAYPANTENINEWRQFLKSSPKTDIVNDYIANGGILHVPLKSILFSSCFIDTSTEIPPLQPPKDNIKRTHDGKPIKERDTTSNVPHANDRGIIICSYIKLNCMKVIYLPNIVYIGSKKSRKPVNPEDDVPVSVLNETEKAEFIRNIFTLKKEMLTRQQLIKLLEDANLKTTGNKQVLLERLQDYYQAAAEKEAEKKEESTKKESGKEAEEERKESAEKESGK